MAFAFSQDGRFGLAVDAAKRGLVFCPPLTTAVLCIRRVATNYMELANFGAALEWWQQVSRFFL